MGGRLSHGIETSLIVIMSRGSKEQTGMNSHCESIPGRVKGTPASFCQTQISSTIRWKENSQGTALNYSVYHSNEIHGNVDNKTG
jgi:hypothetical protein